MEDDALLTVEMSLFLRKLSALQDDQQPSYQQSEIKRRLYFTKSREAVIPLLLADATETEAFGIREVFARVAVRMGSEDAAADYGLISIASGTKEAEVLLDRGLVGRTSADGAITLRNVRVGLREVSLRDAAGREAREIVRVEAGRTFLAHFERLEAAGTAYPIV